MDVGMITPILIITSPANAGLFPGTAERPTAGPACTQGNATHPAALVPNNKCAFFGCRYTTAASSAWRADRYFWFIDTNCGSEPCRRVD